MPGSPSLRPSVCPPQVTGCPLRDSKKQAMSVGGWSSISQTQKPKSTWFLESTPASQALHVLPHAPLDKTLPYF